jgi:hypothetical protein
MALHPKFARCSGDPAGAPDSSGCLTAWPLASAGPGFTFTDPYFEGGYIVIGADNDGTPVGTEGAARRDFDEAGSAGASVATCPISIFAAPSTTSTGSRWP